MSDKKEIKS